MWTATFKLFMACPVCKIFILNTKQKDDMGGIYSPNNLSMLNAITNTINHNLFTASYLRKNYIFFGFPFLISTDRDCVPDNVFLLSLILLLITFSCQLGFTPHLYSTGKTLKFLLDYVNGLFCRLIRSHYKTIVINVSYVGEYYRKQKNRSGISFLLF